MNTWLNRGIGWVRVTCLSLVLLSGCGDSGLSSELDTMQRALWQASGAVRDDRGGTLLHAMEAFDQAATRARPQLAKATPEEGGRFETLHEEFELLLASPNGRAVVGTITTGASAPKFIDLQARLFTP
ncbi:MAG: hypothetical protein MK101_10170 [Phycisphaerales bacterium]|nr:hypothetical protein [Phycisphaerales bacterium]